MTANTHERFARASAAPAAQLFPQLTRDSIEQSIASRFEQVAAHDPTRLAVKVGEQAVTYGALNQMANRIAHALRSAGGAGNEPVAVLVDNDLVTIGAILGIMKAGMIYVPLDRSFSPAWAKYILQDINSKIVLATRDGLRLAASWVGSEHRLIALESLQSGCGDRNPKIAVSPDAISQILYTSGTTGRPKGVMDNHRNMLHYVMRLGTASRISPEDRMTLARPPSSAGALSNLYLALLSGSAIFPLDLKQVEFTAIASWLQTEKITILHTGVTVFRNFAAQLTGTEPFPDLRLIRLGSGQAFAEDLELFNRHFPGALLLHVLSSTETNTYRVHFFNKDSHVPEGALPVGYAVEDMEVLILDDSGHRLGPNQVGEIAVRSGYIFAGYWNSPALTNAVFRADPDDPGRKIYLTGDLGRLRPDGCLEYLGRKDFRVKIRGYRIQTEEVEIALLQVQGISQAAVVAQKDGYGEDRLVAYVTPSTNEIPSVSRIRGALKKTLPDYMVPSNFVFLKSLPLNSNGKVNRRALPHPPTSRPEMETAYVAPRTRVEKLLAKIWSEVLEIDQPGVEDNFFELGGDSLLASRVLSNLSKTRFHLSMRDFLEAPTVAAAAERIERGRGRSHGLTPPPILPIRRVGFPPLSFSQAQLWLLNELFPGTALFNLSSAYRLSGCLDPMVLKKSLTELIKRHEALRTVFACVDDQPVQIIGEAFDVDVPLVDLRHLAAARREKEASRFAGREVSRPFDLAQGPLLRTKLFRLAEEEHLLLVTMHHIISDRWSEQVFWNELATIYQALSLGREPSLPSLPVQFADFVYWEEQVLGHKVMKEQLTYWEKQLGGTLSTLVFNRGKRMASLSFRTSQLSVKLDENLFSTLKDFSRKQRCTPFMVLLGALEVTLHLHTGQKDIRVGTLVANRDRAETERVIGHLINTVILRNRVRRNMTLRELLRQVRDATLGACAHQHLPLETLVRTLEGKRKISRTSLCQVMFIYHNMIVPSSGPANVIFKPHDKVWRRADTGMTLTTFDLILTLKEVSKGVAGNFTFKSETFDSRTANEIRRDFLRILECIMGTPDSMIRNVGKKLTKTHLKSSDQKKAGFYLAQRTPRLNVTKAMRA